MVNPNFAMARERHTRPNCYLNRSTDHLFPPFSSPFSLIESSGLSHGGVTRPGELFSPALTGHEGKQEDAERWAFADIPALDGGEAR